MGFWIHKRLESKAAMLDIYTMRPTWENSSTKYIVAYFFFNLDLTLMKQPHGNVARIPSSNRARMSNHQNNGKGQPHEMIFGLYRIEPTQTIRSIAQQNKWQSQDHRPSDKPIFCSTDP